MIIIPKKAIRFPIQPSLNRASTYTVFCNYTSINFTILYHKRTSALGLHINEAPMYLNNNGVYMIVFRDLRKSEFASNCLNLDYTENENCDYRGKFISIENKFKQDIYQYFGEKLDFQITDNYETNNGTESNYLLALGFKIESYKNDFSYFMFQRKCYSPKYNKSVSRNLCIQFYTRRGERVLRDIIHQNS